MAGSNNRRMPGFDVNCWATAAVICRRIFENLTIQKQYDRRNEIAYC
jgi:hypothetical protein